MKIDIVMPKMGESVTEGTIIKWYKKPGDSVKRDEIIFEISTDKVDTEIPSPEEGILSEILVQEQETVDAGVVVARLSTAGGNTEAAPPAAIDVPEVVKETVTQAQTAPEPVEVNEPAVSSDLVDIPMPKMGESVMEGTIIKWYKKVGESVKQDETFFEISTDKVDTEVTSPSDGVVMEILVQEQETVDVGTVVARISGSGSIATKPATPSKTEVKVEESPIEPVSMHDMIGKAAVAETISNEDEVSSDKFFSPLVLSIASKEGVSISELESIKGSGIGGRVTKNDVFSYLSSRSKAPKATPAATIPQPVPAQQAPVYTPAPQPAYNFNAGEQEIVPMDNIRRKIMQHMVMSRDTSVHVTELAEVDMSKIYRYIQSNKDETAQKHGIKLTYMPFIAHSVIRALREYPLVNSSIDGNNIVQKRFVNLGIAVAVQPNGLIVPNIKNAHEKNIIGLAGSINDIALRARNKKLSPDDITNGTFTITNYGVFGTLFGTPIINQPEVAILGVGAVVKRPVVIEVDGMDTIAIKPMMYLTLAHDHRLVDGMLGGLFLKSVKDYLENFNENMIY